MQEYDIYDADGNVDLDKCQAIADDIAYQEWKDFKYDNPKLYAQICAERESRYKATSTAKADNKAKDKPKKPIFIAHW